MLDDWTWQRVMELLETARISLSGGDLSASSDALGEAAELLKGAASAESHE